MFDWMEQVSNNKNNNNSRIKNVLTKLLQCFNVWLINETSVKQQKQQQQNKECINKVITMFDWSMKQVSNNKNNNNKIKNVLTSYYNVWLNRTSVKQQQNKECINKVITSFIDWASERRMFMTPDNQINSVYISGKLFVICKALVSYCNDDVNIFRL